MRLGVHNLTIRIATSQELSHGLRELTHNVRRRLWITSPFVGGWPATQCLIDNRWRNNSDVEVRLLTDIENKGWLNPITIRKIVERGEVKHLRGLHAKVFIIDDRALVTSANLTGTAFERRHEVGVFLGDAESAPVIRIFEQWWDKAVNPPTGWIEELESSPQRYGQGEEPGGTRLEKLNPLPQPPESGGSDTAPQKTSRDRARPASPTPAQFHSLFNQANRFFVCNTDRRHDPDAEHQMRERGYAAAWEEFSFPSRMKEVERGNGIMFYANGDGIIGIGCAESSCQILEPNAPDRLSRNGHTREWRIPLEWLVWGEGDGGAFDWTSPPPTFFEVNGKRYGVLRNGVRRHFGLRLEPLADFVRR